MARRCSAKHIYKSKRTKHTILSTLLEIQMSKNGTRLWRQAYFQLKMYNSHHTSSTFESSDVETCHAVVARSTFATQNVKKTHGPKPLLEGRMSKNGTPLWRQAYLHVKTYKQNLRFATFLEVPMSKRCPTEEIDRLIRSWSVSQFVK